MIVICIGIFILGVILAYVCVRPLLENLAEWFSEQG